MNIYTFECSNFCLFWLILICSKFSHSWAGVTHPNVTYYYVADVTSNFILNANFTLPALRAGDFLSPTSVISYWDSDQSGALIFNNLGEGNSAFLPMGGGRIKQIFLR
jgi:hypothetical protein